MPPPPISAWPAKGEGEGFCPSPTAPAPWHAWPLSLAARPGWGMEGMGLATSHAGHSGSLLFAAGSCLKKPGWGGGGGGGLPPAWPSCWGQRSPLHPTHFRSLGTCPWQLSPHTRPTVNKFLTNPQCRPGLV